MLSIALLGNRVRKPPSSYPPWIHDFEQGDHMVVSNEPAAKLFLQVLGGAFSLIVLAIRAPHIAFLTTSSHRRGAHHRRRLYGRSARVHALLGRSCRAQAGSCCLGCLAVLAYLKEHRHECWTLLMLLRVPVLTASLSYGCTSTLLEWALAVHISLTFSRLHRDSISRRRVLLPQVAKMDSQAKGGRDVDGGLVGVYRTKTLLAKVWVMWLSLCVCISCPGALYAMLRTIPGFLKSYPVLERFITYSVSFCTSFLTVLCLPSVAVTLKKSYPSLSPTELLSVANFVALPLVPTLLSVLCHTNCLGQWTRMWPPCNHLPSPLDAMEHLRLYFYSKSFDDNIRAENGFFNEALLKRNDVCGGKGSLSSGKCLDAIIDASSSMLLSTAVHLTFTSALARVLTSRPMKVRALLVNVVRLWMLVLVFGAAVPLLVFLSGLSFLVHKWVFFGSAAFLLLADEDDEDAYPDLPHISIRVAQWCSCLLQLSLLVVNSDGSA